MRRNTTQEINGQVYELQEQLETERENKKEKYCPELALVSSFLFSITLL